MEEQGDQSTVLIDCVEEQGDQSNDDFNLFQMVGHTGEAMEMKRKAKQPVEENEGEAMETKRKAKEPVEENESAH